MPNWPAGNSVGLLTPRDESGVIPLASILASFAFDWQIRGRQSGSNVNWFLLAEATAPNLRACTPLVPVAGMLYGQRWLAFIRTAAHTHHYAATPHERLRLRCMLDAMVAVLYGLQRDDFAWILKDCDHPVERVTSNAFARQLDPKGFWRVDKNEDPELRHTVLSLVAFDALQATIAAAGHDRDAGLRAFCDQNDGDGWMLPEHLCLADLGLTRTVDIGVYDAHAQIPRPVRSRLGDRFLDWQLAQTPEESWAECERHARAIREGLPGPPAPAGPAPTKPVNPSQGSLF